MAERERDREMVAVGGERRTGGARHAAGHQAIRAAELADAIAADRRLAKRSFWEALFIGGSQILALLAGISRDGVAMVGGMFRRAVPRGRGQVRLPAGHAGHPGRREC